MGRFIKIFFLLFIIGASIVIGIYFGWQNDDPVTVRFRSFESTLPLFALCYLFMIGGLFVTLFIVAYDYITMYAQNRSLKRQLRYYLRQSQEKRLSGADSVYGDPSSSSHLKDNP